MARTSTSSSMARRASTSNTSITACPERRVLLRSRASGTSAMTASAETILRQAIEAHRRGAIEDAQRLYRQVLSLDPRSDAACGNLAIIAAQQGDLAGAERLFRQALDLRPNDPQ